MKLALACANDPTADVEFWIENCGNGIVLCGRKPNGFKLSILGINTDGVLETYAFISSLGLQVDKNEKIKINDA